ncbi:MAG: hypothetical protein GY870_01875 [archaeon]|nr:hypothetical protein [archaeon]
MGRNTTVFIRKPEEVDNYAFIQMTHKISRLAGISVQLVQQMGEKAINKWEKSEKKTIKNIYYLKSEGRQIQVDKMLNYFRHYLSFLVPEHKIDQTLNVASDAFEQLFFL